MGNTPSDGEGDDGSHPTSSEAAPRPRPKSSRGGRNDEFEKLMRPGFQPGQVLTEMKADEESLPPVSPRGGSQASHPFTQDYAYTQQGATQAATYDTTNGNSTLADDTYAYNGEVYDEGDNDELYDDRFGVHIAAHEGNLQVLKRALERNFRFTAFDTSGRTPLFYAAAQNHVECCAELLQRRPDLLNLGDSEGDRPLHVASYYGHQATLNLLLQQPEIDVNIRNNKGFSPLHVCSCTASCKMLMDAHGDLFAIDEHGRVPLFTACATNKKHIVTEILDNPLCDIHKMLLIQDSYGDSALHAAACNGSLECIKAFKGFLDLELIRLANHQGYTAKDLASLNGQEECAKYIDDLMNTLYKSQYERAATLVWSQQQFENLPYDNNGGFFNGRPQTAAGFDLGRNYFGSMRPQSAQTYQDFTGLPMLDGSMRASFLHLNTGIGGNEESWEAFNHPIEESNQEDRASTPWSTRRQDGQILDWRGEWAQFIDKETGEPFYWNAITGESSWEVPAGLQDELPAGEDTGFGFSVEDEGAEISEAEQIRQRAFVRKQILSWSECEDPVTGDVFYYNNESGECEWELPADAEEERLRLQREEEEQFRQHAESEAQEMVISMRGRTEELEALKESVKAEAAAEIAEKLRKEFEEKMKATAEQTAKLVEQIESANEKQEKEKEKAEILAEHGQEVKKLASLLSSERMRQNDKLQQKLQERRKARALKRAQIMNRTKVPASVAAASKSTGAPTPSNASISSHSVRKLATTPSSRSIGGGAPQPAHIKPSSVLDSDCVDVFRRASQQTPQVQVLVSVHMQYINSKDEDVVGKSGENSLLYALYRAYSTPPKGMPKDGLRRLLDAGSLKLSMFDRDAVVDTSFEASKDQAQYLDFEAFLQSLDRVVVKMACPALTYCKESLVPTCVQAGLEVEQRSRIYQKESKRLATGAIRKILQANVSQLKMVYLFYALIAEKRGRAATQKTITVEEMVLFATDFSICPTFCSKSDLLQLFLDASIRKPGSPGSLKSHEVPFNQWVQLVFHLAIRFCKPKEESQDAKEEFEDAHLYVLELLVHLDKYAKQRIKSFKAFICVDPQQQQQQQQ